MFYRFGQSGGYGAADFDMGDAGIGQRLAGQIADAYTDYGDAAVQGLGDGLKAGLVEFVCGVGVAVFFNFDKIFLTDGVVSDLVNVKSSGLSEMQVDGVSIHRGDGEAHDLVLLG
jgi:hypothetical protein